MWQNSHCGVKGQGGTFQLALVGDLNQMETQDLKELGEGREGGWRRGFRGGYVDQRWVVPLLAHKEPSEETL